jgi:pyruvate/2-oxoglutarate dehydrogenase complex dihydrolipoamide acyltransferase (E2) component
MKRLLPASTALLLCLAGSGCSDPKIETYRVKKDPAAAPTATAAATPASPAPAPAATAPAATAPAAPAAAPAATVVAADRAAMANTAVATASGQGLQWTAPASWTAKAGSAMRKGTYAIKGAGGEAELAITAFPGDVGGDLANVNRWRGQVGLGPIGSAELASSITRFRANSLDVAVIDILGSNGQRILGGIVPFTGSTWFFKLTGPDAVVAAEKPVFVEYMKTVRAP